MNIDLLYIIKLINCIYICVDYVYNIDIIYMINKRRKVILMFRIKFDVMILYVYVVFVISNK